MLVDLAMVGAVLGLLTAIVALFAPVAKLHSRIDLLTFQVKDLRGDVRALERTLYCRPPDEPPSGPMS